jgi:iron complex outermembrane recepter protein
MKNAPLDPAARRLPGRLILSGASLTALTLAAGQVYAQQAATPPSTEYITVHGTTDQGYATSADYQAGKADLGPLGTMPVQDTPLSISTVPEALIVNQQAQTVNDTLRYLPSVEVRPQQGFEVSRPQSRGFQGTIAQNTRVDGLNVIGTTAIPAENLAGIQVLNGLAGALYGPETPAGIFKYVLKRPTDTPLLRLSESFDSDGVFTEGVDAGRQIDGIGYRLNAVRGDGNSYVSGSSVDRTLFSTGFDFPIDDKTVLETNYSYYETNITGLPGSIVYDGGKSAILPSAIDPTRPGYGQPGAGADFITNMAVVKIKRQFNDTWSLEAGGL